MNKLSSIFSRFAKVASENLDTEVTCLDGNLHIGWLIKSSGAYYVCTDGVTLEWVKTNRSKIPEPVRGWLRTISGRKKIAAFLEAGLNPFWVGSDKGVDWKMVTNHVYERIGE